MITEVACACLCTFIKASLIQAYNSTFSFVESAVLAEIINQLLQGLRPGELINIRRMAQIKDGLPHIVVNVLNRFAHLLVLFMRWQMRFLRFPPIHFHREQKEGLGDAVM